MDKIKEFAYIYAIGVLSAFVCIGMVHAWTEPVVAPPGGGGALYYDGTDVGIQNTNPQASLDVSGTIRAEEICDEGGANCKDVSTGWTGGLWSQNGSDIYYDSGNIGIGTSSPSARVDIANGASGLRIVNGDGTHTWFNYTNSNTNYLRGTTTYVDTELDMNQHNITDGNTIYMDNWYRSYGNTGWYSQDYGGGWHMTDSTWLRAYNDKSVYTGSGTIRSDSNMRAPIYYDQNNTGYYTDPASTSRMNTISSNQIYNNDGWIRDAYLRHDDCYWDKSINSGELGCNSGWYVVTIDEDGDGMDRVKCCRP
jgi:hypothetical protein